MHTYMYTYARMHAHTGVYDCIDILAYINTYSLHAYICMHAHTGVHDYMDILAYIHTY